MTKKELVHDVSQATFGMMDLPTTISNVSVVVGVENDLFGNALTLKNEMNSPGSSYGSKKATPFEDSLSFRDIAPLKLNKSKIIGLTRDQNKTQTFPASNTSFMTVRTSARTTALSR